MDETTVGHVHSRHLLHLAIKKKILPFSTVWIDTENIMQSEISQSEKYKYHMI